MSAVEALALARERGVHVAVSGTDLILEAACAPSRAVLEAIRRNKAEIVALLVADRDEWTAETWWMFFNERAGIAEFDGEQSRADEEVQAFECCVAEWLNRHPSRTDPGHCAACRKPDREGHTVVPFGSETHGHTWLHPECWRGWYEAWKAEAVTALAAMNIESPANFSNDFGKNGNE